MSAIETMLHPTFEALSAHADEAHDVASATRVGRHVARCGQCAAQVAEIRALGDAARAMVVAGAPEGLWSRIEAGASAKRGRSERADQDIVPADRSVPVARSHRAMVVAAVMLVGAAAAAALWPRPASLQAAGLSRLTFTPTRPLPGGAVTVRYTPPAGLPTTGHLVLAGRFVRPAGENRVSWLWWSPVDELADSVAELAPSGDGAFVGTMRLPADFLAVSLAVHDPAGDRVDVDGGAPWMVIGGTPAGSASLAALLAAHDIRSGIFNLAAPPKPRQAVDIADSLKRYFPQHPAGWAFGRSYGMARGRFDFLRFFQGAERKYSTLFDALWPQPTLDAERLHDMAVFARNIDEPSEVLRWSGRLAREHPEDPRALFDLAGGLHELELASTPGVADSVRRWLPDLDVAYRRAAVPNPGYYDARLLAERYGDSTTRAVWIGREAANGYFGSDASESVRAPMRRRAEVRCGLPAGRLPLLVSIGEWRARCEFQRGIAYGFLSSISLQMGHPRDALLEADSARIAAHRGEVCRWTGGDLAHARAALALGDTTMAESDVLAAAARLRLTRTQALATAQALDTAQVWLGVPLDRRFCDSAARISTAPRRGVRGGHAHASPGQVGRATEIAPP